MPLSGPVAQQLLAETQTAILPLVPYLAHCAGYEASARMAEVIESVAASRALHGPNRMETFGRSGIMAISIPDGRLAAV
jgi:hypothetical protein